MENRFLIDAKHLSEAALKKKSEIENNPSARRDHREYFRDMEKIDSTVCEDVISQMNAYDYLKYAAKDVMAALEHETCTIEDFKALLSPAAEPFLEKMAQKARS